MQTAEPETLENPGVFRLRCVFTCTWGSTLGWKQILPSNLRKKKMQYYASAMISSLVLAFE